MQKAVSVGPSRRALLAVLALLGVGSLAWIGLGRGESPAVAAGPPRRVSLLALGDTGHEPGPVATWEGQRAVADALVAADREAPVDAIVLLGDNFYPDGLREREFKERLRQNVVSPYCHFLQLTARGRGSMEDACGVTSEKRHPVPFFAVLGNHDYGERESPLLQTKRIPEYVENWIMPRGQVELQELEGGVSLLLLNSQQIVEGESTELLVRALRASRGPWRIIAAHHPMADPGRGYDPRYTRRVAEALEQADVPVHLFLAGHEHNLQVLTLPPPAPPLHVVAGAGSEYRQVQRTRDERRFGLESTGFVRVDLVPAAEEPVLQVTLYAVEEPGLLGGARGVAVSRWAITLEEDVRELLLPTDAS